MNIQDVIQEQRGEKLRNDFYKSMLFKDSVSIAPTNTPKTFDEQIVIYKNGTTYRLYIYVDDTWRQCSLT